MPRPSREASQIRDTKGVAHCRCRGNQAAGLRPQSLRLFAEQHPLRAALRDYAGAFIMIVFFALALLA